MLKKTILLLLILTAGAGWSYADSLTAGQDTDNTAIESAADVELEDAQEDILSPESAPADPADELAKLSLSALTLQAEQGDSEALLALGDRYYYGKGGAGRDRSQALEYYLKAAELDCPVSQFNLGHMYRSGIGTKQNMQKALDWFERAANLGDPEAQFMAAEMHGTGSGVPHNNVRAYMWYKIAYTTMEPRFRGIAKAELDTLKTQMTKEETAQAEALVQEWQKNSGTK